MGFTIKKNEGKKFEPVPAGAHPAICYMLVDLGTHHNPKFDKTARKAVIGFEFPEITERRADGSEFRRSLSKRYTVSMHEKSSLRGMLESWRGKKFSDEELAEFDLKSILGKPCLVNVITSMVDGRERSDIQSIGPLPKSMQNAYKLDGSVVYYSMEDNGFELPEALPEWIKTAISESIEFKKAAESAGDDLPY